LSPSVPRSVIAHFARQRRLPPPSALQTLTARERDVFRFIATGLSNAEIGHLLFISDTTVKTHVTRLLQELEVRDPVQATVLGYQNSLFDR
jgi:DNA-binding NarL/FixJ family response regulator